MRSIKNLFLIFCIPILWNSSYNKPIEPHPTHLAGGGFVDHDFYTNGISLQPLTEALAPFAVTDATFNLPRIVDIEYIFDPAIIEMRGYAEVERVLRATTVMAGYYKEQADIVINLKKVHFPEQNLSDNTSNPTTIIDRMADARVNGTINISDNSLAILITNRLISLGRQFNGYARIFGLCSINSNAIISNRVVPGAPGGTSAAGIQPLPPLYLSEILAHETGHVLSGMHNCGLGGIMAPFFDFVPRDRFSNCSINQFDNFLDTSAADCVFENNVIASGYDGSWFDFSHNGEGFQIEILNNERALVTWYTFDAFGNQRWLIGVGQLEANRIVIDELTISRGAVFGAAFNPDDVQRTTWGSAILTFEDCRNGFISYIENETDTPGIQNLSRLTNLGSLPCDAQTPADPVVQDVTGNWSDPNHNGEGLMIEQINPDVILFNWFSFDDLGEQAWFVGLADKQVDGSYLAEDVTITAGGVFGPTFDPDQVLRTLWGSLRLTFSDCENATLEYSSVLPEFGQGNQNLRRLTKPIGINCQSTS